MEIDHGESKRNETTDFLDIQNEVALPSSPYEGNPGQDSYNEHV